MDRQRIDDETVVGYLVDEGVLDDAAGWRAEPLGGGVSNEVLRVVGDDESFVVKQPFENLAVEDDWPADVTRVHNEAAAARAYGDIIDAEAIRDVAVPAVVFEDREHNVIVLECAPSSAEMWKAQLLDGRVDVDVARSLGRFLAVCHDRAAENQSLREHFESIVPFDQLRLDPYHRTVAQRHPDVEDAVEAEVDRITACRETLVHGDFSPKNVLVSEAPEGSIQWVLDFEVAHWGDPAFDVAFMLNHLFIKSIYMGERRYVSGATAFWDAYTAASSFSTESNAVTELGILMLARVDGKSPVEYVTQEATKQRLREVAKTTLREELDTVAAFAELVQEVGLDE